VTTPISPLQFDLATAVLRMAQAHELGPDSPRGGHLVDRLLECDLPRLRGHLDAAGRALIAAADGEGPLPVRLDPRAGEAEPTPEQLAKIAALPDGSMAGVLTEDASVLDLARGLLKDLDEHATPGQWRYQGGDEVLVFPADGGMARQVAEVWSEPREERAIGSFIAVSRQLMPALVAEIERLRHRALMDDLAYKGVVKRAEKAEEATARVLALHTEFKIYEDCGHATHEDDAETVELAEGGHTCKTTPLYSVCRHCCAPGEGLTYDHEESHDPVDCWPCPTRRAVEGS
jgi:hypothetical protein